MALFNLECSCGSKKRLFATIFSKLSQEQKLCQCGKEMLRVGNGPTTQVMERLDNGCMPKALERHAEAERIFEERRLAADPLAGTNKNYS